MEVHAADGASLHHDRLRGALEHRAPGRHHRSPDDDGHPVRAQPGARLRGLLPPGPRRGALGVLPAGSARAARRPGGGVMAIGVKVLKRPEREVSYVRAAFKGMALTFKHMLEPKVTMQRSEEHTSELQ